MKLKYVSFDLSITAPGRGQELKSYMGLDLQGRKWIDKLDFDVATRLLTVENDGETIYIPGERIVKMVPADAEKATAKK